MNHPPLVSVIMNCHNGEKYLNEAIDSVYDQNYPNFEIIFWDNNSSDNSKLIALSYDDRIKYFYSSTTTDLGQARNLAIKKSKGKFICFLDTDDVFVKNKFIKQINLMSKNKFLMSYGSVRFFKDNKTIWMRKAKNKSGYLIKNLLKDYEIAMNSVMIDRDILQDEKYSFNTSLKYSPDYNLFMKIALNYEIGVLKDLLGKIRIHDNSLTKKLFYQIPKEQLFTLNELLSLDQNTLMTYKFEYNYAIKKTKYYEAIAHISVNKYKLSRKILSEVIFDDIKYLVLYLILLLPIKSSTILRFLRR